MIEEFSVGLDNGIKFTFKLGEKINLKKLFFLQKTRTVDDIRKALEENGISYTMEVSQYGVKFATPKSWRKQDEI